MPELPEVETVVRALRHPLIGRTFTGFESYWPRQVILPDDVGELRYVLGDDGLDALAVVGKGGLPRRRRALDRRRRLRGVVANEAQSRESPALVENDMVRVHRVQFGSGRDDVTDHIDAFFVARVGDDRHRSAAAGPRLALGSGEGRLNADRQGNQRQNREQRDESIEALGVHYEQTIQIPFEHIEYY